MSIQPIQARVTSQQMSLMPSKEEFEILQMIAKTASESPYFTKLGGVAGILSIALYAKELGIPVMTALMGGLINVQGKITMAPEMMNSLIRQNGHKVEVLESTNSVCRIRGTRRDSGESYVSSYSIEDANKAGLVRAGSGYEKYSSDMLFARCISRLRRRLFPDVASRSYVHGEIEEEVVHHEVNTHTGEIVPEMAVLTICSKLSEKAIANIDKQIQEFIDPVDKSYKARLLAFHKVNSLAEIDSSLEPRILEGIAKKIESLKNKELESGA